MYVNLNRAAAIAPGAGLGKVDRAARLQSLMPPFRRHTPRHRGFGDVVTGTVGGSSGLTATVSSADQYLQDILIPGQVNAQPGQIGYAGDPATLAANFTQVLSDRCAMYPFSCTGQSVPALVSAAVDQVMASRTGGVPAPGGVTYYPAGNIACQSGYVISPDQTSCVPPTPAAPTLPAYVGPTQPPAPQPVAYTGAPLYAVPPAAPPAVAPASAPAGMNLSFLTQPVSILGAQVPVWGIAAALGLAIMAFSSRGK